MNGRQPIFEAAYDHDQGPWIEFRNQRINCVKDQTFDGNCGQHWVDGDGYVLLTVGGVYQTGSICNNRLNYSDDYFATITGEAHPNAAGAPWMTMPTVRSPNFNCLGIDPCYFPNG